ncbi:type II secretion system protein [Desulfonatronum sp. SC1]|uniref:type II secretion system protein n=1 Tax=Desulfonatronum sp. SC1 TaxID=2109626 RepID=UPI000D2FAFA5|nr:type II secretion system protein [Desulfonatronum sp. SC1]PTN37532.1 hypothetical protein C6366_06115 [Desulfonatronum sp. SC1]
MYNCNKNEGFTLIECIVFLVLLGIFGAYLVTYIGSTTQSSVIPVQWLESENALQDRMEKLVAEYRRIVTETDDAKVTTHADLEALKDFALTEYTSYVYSAETGYITFDVNGISGPWPPDSNIQSQEPVLVVTLQHGDQKVSSLFMASE